MRRISNLPPASKAHDVVRIDLLLNLPQASQVRTKDPIQRRVLLRIVAIERRIGDILALGDGDLGKLCCTSARRIADELIGRGELPREVDVEREERTRALGWVRGRVEGALAEDALDERLDVVRQECGGRKAQSGAPELQAWRHRVSEMKDER